MYSAKRITLVALAAIAICISSSFTASGEDAKPAKPLIKVTYKTTEFGIGNKSPLDWQAVIMVSPDGRHYASINKYDMAKDGPQAIIIDGIKGKEYVDITHITFSPDSKHLAYAGTAKKGGNSTLVVDGFETQVEGTVDMIIYSPDSKRIAYFVTASGQPEKHHVVVDGKQEKEYSLLFNGKNVMKWWITISLTQSIPFFSPDSKHYAYSAFSDGKWCMVVDGAEGKKYENVEYFADVHSEVFSPDSKHISYAVVSNQKSFIVLDSKEIEGGYHKVAFSPDGKHIAYVIRKSEHAHFVVRDGKAGDEYEIVSQPVFSPILNTWLTLPPKENPVSRFSMANVENHILNQDSGLGQEKLYSPPIQVI